MNRAGESDWARRTVAPSVALALLEVLRERDRPKEILEDEVLSATLPRRLGLSDVVDAQIRRYGQEARRGRRVSEGELRDLVHLIKRRPDAERVMTEAGRRLGDLAASRKPRGLLSRRLTLRMARREVGRLLRELFGRPVAEFGPGPFVLAGDRHLLITIDPGGDGCGLVSGLCQVVLTRYLGEEARLRHTHCRALGDTLCQWTLIEGPAEVPVIDLDAPELSLPQA